MDGTRIGLVLSAGGLRGAAHLGVIRQLARHAIPTDVIVGASVGAVIAAYYAAVGLTIEQMASDARDFRGRHMVAHSFAVRAWTPLRSWLKPLSGIIPQRLEQLHAGRFDQLHHGVQAIGVVCHDVTNRRPRYLSTAGAGGVSLYDAVATSAAIPSMFAPRPVEYAGSVCHFTDGGVSDPVPIDFARQPGLDASHLIVSDCRQLRTEIPESETVVCVRPQLSGTTTLRAPRASLLEAVNAGDAAVTEAVLDRVRGWMTQR